MTDYVKTSLRFRLSTNSDYTKPEEDFTVDATETPGEKLIYKGEISTTALTLDLGSFTTITSMVIRNRSATAAETVRARWFTQHGTVDDTVTFAQAATGDTITDDGASGVYLTNNATTGDWVRLSDCATAGNDGAWQIRTAAASVITIVDESTLTADASDAVTMSFEARNTQAIKAGGFLRVDDNIVPDGDLVLDADSGTPHIEVYIFGS